jgi:hypothetical protein
MNEIYILSNEANIFEQAIVLGVTLAVCFILTGFIGIIWSNVWSWIDDNETEVTNPINRIALLLCAGRKTDIYDYWRYRAFFNVTRTDDILIIYFWAISVLLSAPIAILLAVKLYEISLFIVAVVLIAHLARFARRHKKVFDKHVKDPDAHKE